MLRAECDTRSRPAAALRRYLPDHRMMRRNLSSLTNILGLQKAVPDRQRRLGPAGAGLNAGECPDAREIVQRRAQTIDEPVGVGAGKIDNELIFVARRGFQQQLDEISL